MSKKKNTSFFLSLIVFTVVTAVVLFSYVFLVEKIKVLKKEKADKENLLIERTNKLSAQLVKLQSLSSEEEIVKRAEIKLGLVLPDKPFEILKIDEELVKNLEKTVSSIYD